jgi:homoserine kinase
MRSAFRAQAVYVRVPATSANLGPGFDALGLALSLHDDVVARVSSDGVRVDVLGEGADEVARDGSNLVVQAMRAAFERLGGQPPGLALSCVNRIPHGRGLGSSAAAIVAGVLLARGLVVGGEKSMPDPDVLALACELEGHADNVAACLLGGLTIAWTGADQRARALRLVPSGVAAVLFVPATPSSTQFARQLLPAEVPHADAAYNSARSALLVAALTGVPEHLLVATDDRLHQTYRASQMPGSARLVAALRGAGIPAVISGAGPSVLALTRDRAEVERALLSVPTGWGAERLDIDYAGAHLLPMGL